MAERRMFSKSIIDSDLFLDMPATTQMLYFHLAMRADDDGFINNPKRIMRMIGASDDDMRILIAKQFVILFDSGIVVIKHWRIHNYIRSDRYKPSIFVEKNSLHLDKGMVYQENSNYNHSGIPNDNQPGTNGIPDVNQTGDNMDTQVRLDKDRTNNLSILDATSKKIPTLIEIQTFAEQEGLCVDVQKFYDYYTETGWMTKNQQPITNWKSTLLYWNQSEGTPHKKTKQEEPRSENADIYESLIGRVLL
mgnify:CR=1 FL=1